MAPVDLALALLVVFVAVLAVTLIQHLFLTVPFIPTPQPVVEAMITAADIRGNETVYDLGAGDARLLIAAKKKYPGITAKGCELVWVVWLLARLRIWNAGENVALSRESLFTVDVSDADVVFLYLFPSMMHKLEARFDRMLKPGTRVVSHGFRFSARTPKKTLQVGKKHVFVYEW